MGELGDVVLIKAAFKDFPKVLLTKLGGGFTILCSCFPEHVGKVGLVIINSGCPSFDAMVEINIEVPHLSFETNVGFFASHV